MMQAHRHKSGSFLAIALFALALSATKNDAECVATKDTYDEVVDVLVETCSDPIAAARNRSMELSKESWFVSWLAENRLGIRTVESYVEWVQGKNRGKVLDVTIVRSRRIMHSEQAPIPKARSWQVVSDRQTLLLTGSDNLSCETFEVGEQVLMFIREPCCDTVPPSELSCLLHLRPVSAIPQWVRDAGLLEVN